MSQRELGARAGLSHAYISRVEDEGRTPSLLVLRSIAKALGTTALLLETGRDYVSCPHCGRRTSNG